MHARNAWNDTIISYDFQQQRFVFSFFMDVQGGSQAEGGEPSSRECTVNCSTCICPLHKIAISLSSCLSLSLSTRESQHQHRVRRLNNANREAIRQSRKGRRFFSSWEKMAMTSLKLQPSSHLPIIIYGISKHAAEPSTSSSTLCVIELLLVINFILYRLVRCASLLCVSHFLTKTVDDDKTRCDWRFPSRNFCTPHYDDDINKHKSFSLFHCWCFVRS